MGIYDRDYARPDGPGNSRGRRGPSAWSSAGGPLGRLRLLSVNTWIIAINIVVFVIVGLTGTAARPVFFERTFTVEDVPSQVAEAKEFLPMPNSPGFAMRPLVDPRTGAVIGRAVYQIMDPLTEWGHFSTDRGFYKLEVWRLVTFQFLHAGILHIGMNMLGLYFFGPLVEEYLGRKRYAAFYLMCGICGGLAYLLLNLIGAVGISLPGALDVQTTTSLVGASAGVFGIIMACAFIAPTLTVQLLFPPIPMKMRTMAYLFVGLAALNLFFFRGDNQGGDAAHMGGAIAGYFFIRRPHLLRDFFDVLGPKKSSGASAKAKARKPVLRGGAKSGASDAEVDRVLDKVRAEGLGSLTDSEKKVLRSATEEQRG